VTTKSVEVDRAAAHVAAFAAVYGATGWLATSQAAPSATAMMFTAVLGGTLAVLSAIDVMTLRLPDWLTLPLAVLGLWASYHLALDDVVLRVAAAVVGYLLLFAIAEVFARWRKVDALGMGDAKLFAAAGAWLGFGGLADVLLWSSVSALVVAVLARLAGYAIRRDTQIPFGPFLAAATWLAWLTGPALSQ
jgi:leader peptidase (prepilin peptidase)/N-methyltransferase